MLRDMRGSGVEARSVVLRTLKWVERCSQLSNFLTFHNWFLNQSVRVVLQIRCLSPLPLTQGTLLHFLQDTAVTRAYVYAWKDTERKVCDLPKAARLSVTLLEQDIAAMVYSHWGSHSPSRCVSAGKTSIINLQGLYRWELILQMW